MLVLTKTFEMKCHSLFLTHTPKLSSMNFAVFILNALIYSMFYFSQYHMCAQRNAHCTPSMEQCRSPFCQASSDDIELCAEEAEFRPINPYDEDIYFECISIMKDKNWVPAFDAQEATDILSA